MSIRKSWTCIWRGFFVAVQDLPPEQPVGLAFPGQDHGRGLGDAEGEADQVAVQERLDLLLVAHRQRVLPEAGDQEKGNRLAQPLERGMVLGVDGQGQHHGLGRQAGGQQQENDGQKFFFHVIPDTGSWSSPCKKNAPLTSARPAPSSLKAKA